MLKPNYTIITPFKRWTIQNFPFIEEDFDAITNYQLLCKIIEYLNKVIANQKELEKANNELIDSFNTLKKYVDDYFKNLDVQDEINNKLDEMADSGELTDIIAQYLGLAGVLAFNTLTDLKNGDNLVNGSICYTLGIDTIKDGKGGFYKIRPITSADVVDNFNIVALNFSDTLIAERIENNTNDMLVFDSIEDLQDSNDLKNGVVCYTEDTMYQIRPLEAGEVVDEENILSLNNYNDLFAVKLNNFTPYYDEITYKYSRANDSNYYIVDIPLNDNSNNEIPFELIESEVNKSPLENSHIKDSNFLCNGSLAVYNGNTYVDGNIIINGVIVNDNDVSAYCTNEKYLGIKANREFAIYNNDTSATDMLNDGCLFACLIFGKCATGGVIDPSFTFQTTKGPDIFIGQKANKDLMIIACDGRDNHNKGMDYQEMSQILIDNGCVDVYALDGGGSTSLNYKGNKLNMNIDDEGVKDRKISYLFNVTKVKRDEKLNAIYNFIGDMKHLLNYQLRPLINNKQNKIEMLKMRRSNDFTPSNVSTVIPFVLSAPDTRVITHTDDENGGTHFTFPDFGVVKYTYKLTVYGNADTTVRAESYNNNVLYDVDTYETDLKNGETITIVNTGVTVVNYNETTDLTINLSATNNSDVTLKKAMIWLEYINYENDEFIA